MIESSSCSARTRVARSLCRDDFAVEGDEIGRLGGHAQLRDDVARRRARGHLQFDTIAAAVLREVTAEQARRLDVDPHPSSPSRRSVASVGTPSALQPLSS